MAIQAAMKEKKETGKEEFAQVTSDSVMTMLQRLEGQIEEAEEKEINLAEDLEKAKRASAFMRAKMSELMTTLDKLGLEQIVTRQPYDDEIRKALAKVSLTRLQREGATDEQIETLITQRASWQDRMKIEDCLPAEKKAAIEVRRVFGIPQPRKSAKPASGKKKEPVKASGGSSGSPGTAKKTVVVKSSKEGAKPVAKKSAKPASGKAVALPVIEPVEGTQRAEVDETLAPDKYGTLSSESFFDAVRR